MDYVINIFSELLNSSDQGRWLFLLLASTSAIALGLSFTILIFNWMNPVRRRLSHIAAQHPDDSLNSEEQWHSAALESMSGYLTPQSDKERGSVVRLLTHAGFEHKQALTNFYAIKVLLAVLFGVTMLIASQFLPNLKIEQVLLCSFAAMLMGLMLPNLVLHRIAGKRIIKMQRTFPDALDLLVVSSEAGLGFNAALNRVADEIGAMCPELGTELQMVCTKIRMGVTVPDALRQMVERTGLDEVRGLASVISQSLKMGSSLGETLRVYAEEFRDRRTQKAEELAAKIGTKLIFPLVLFIWPGFFVVAVGPVIIAVLELFNR